MKFTRIRLSGFKSFVDPTELHIEPGLTGIVGPNGCGKSNIVEALRWVMGESAPRQMRSTEMDDVIFAGTTDRPPRNIAEVLLTLDNEERGAPAAYNESAEIDVSRRIERGSGSLFRVNGRDVRARDVQTLFADSSSGARTTAIVNQGRVGELVNAKPTERRRVLEEAAGITGLHARRHEAELRLRAAETNLERLDDIIGTLEEQQRALKRQARQATRYRNLSDHIRRAEASLFHRRWAEVSEAAEDAKQALATAEEAVEETTRLVSRAVADQEEKAEAIPPLRRAEAEAAAALQALLVKRDGLVAEERRIAEAAEALETQIRQFDGDLSAAHSRRTDAAAALERLGSEAEEITARDAAHESTLSDLGERLSAADSEARAAEDVHAEAVRALAEAETRRASFEQRLREIRERLSRIEARREELQAEQAARTPLSEFETAHAASQTQTAAAQSALDRIQVALEEAEAERGTAEGAQAAALEALRRRESEIDKARAEIDALAALIEVGEPGLWPPMIDVMTVKPGFEVAFGAALGDDLLASGDEAAPVHWRDLGLDQAAPALPDGARPLSDFVDAPPALTRRLSQIGLVEDEATGDALAGRLVQGQRLVARTGAFWRWDGFRVTAGTPTSAANRMAQRNRLDGLRAGLQPIEDELRHAKEAAEGASARLREAMAVEERLRGERRVGEQTLSSRKDAQSDAAAALAREQSWRRAAEEALESVAVEIAEAGSALATAEAEQSALPDADSIGTSVEDARSRRDALRASADTIRQDHQHHLAEAEQRRRRLHSIGAELESWNARATEADRQIEDLETRLASARGERDALAEKPQALAEERESLQVHIAEAEGVRDRAAQALADAEARQEESARALRAAEARLADERETRVRRESAVEQAALSMKTIAERIRERLDCAPEVVLEAAGLDPEADLPDAEALQTKLERLVRERDNMGPVNLRAEAEAEELATRIAEMHQEREDLLGAISKLRQGIAGLNREGRERLMAAFETIDGHFQNIFKRLFAGGTAKLTLTEAEDPFESGLEVMACPPGKRLQNMSLMSGGEQALTAVSLMFAVFLTNPAPICVLDEVDAPLDDNNVDRFCSLLDEIAHGTETRFLLITHHRLTMARMDRLYGVTMPEQGVSQLVSVDLMAAERLRESA